MSFRSKVERYAGIAAVVTLVSGALVGPAFAQLVGPPHAPYLARSAPQKAKAVLPASSSIAANRALSSTQSDVASEPLPVVRSGRAPTRALLPTRAHHGGPPR